MDGWMDEHYLIRASLAYVAVAWHADYASSIVEFLSR